jgi:hypothetical protein
MLDLNGADYGNYPIHLPATATNGCAFFDFDQPGNYKLFVACSNRMIYAYDISGKPMSGWLFNQPVSDVTDPLQNFRVKDKDYILVYNHSGTIFLLDRKGSVRASLKKEYLAKNSTFYLLPGDSLEEDRLVSTDTTGKIVSLSLNGTVKLKSYGTLTADHTFTAADVDGDGKYDFALRHSALPSEIIRRPRTEIPPRGESAESGGRGAQVWQTKDLRKGVFGSVAMIGLSKRSLGSVANKGVNGVLEEDATLVARDEKSRAADAHRVVKAWPETTP